jgi:hypothetical protein
MFDVEQRGLSLEQISQELEAELKILKQFLPHCCKNLALLTTARPTAGHLIQRLRKTNSLLSHNPPKSSINQNDTNKLHRVNLLIENNPAIECLRTSSRIPWALYGSGLR